MIATIVNVWIKEGCKSEFLRATYENYLNSVKEPGNIRFDILQDDSDPLKFTFYEVFDSEDAVAAHKMTDHYQKWKNTVESQMARPRQGIKHTVIYPSEPEK